MNFFQTIIAFCGGFIVVATIAIVATGAVLQAMFEVKRPGQDLTQDTKDVGKGCVALLFFAMAVALVTRLMIVWAA